MNNPLPVPFTQNQGRRIRAAFCASESMRQAMIKGDTETAIKMCRIIRENRDVFDAARILIDREMAWLDMMEGGYAAKAK